jgi:hypothetical protein
MPSPFNIMIIYNLLSKIENTKSKSKKMIHEKQLNNILFLRQVHNYMRKNIIILCPFCDKVYQHKHIYIHKTKIFSKNIIKKYNDGMNIIVRYNISKIKREFNIPSDILLLLIMFSL